MLKKSEPQEKKVKKKMEKKVEKKDRALGILAVETGEQNNR